MKKIYLSMLLVTFLPLLLFAHEGHGHTNGYTITHYFVEPEHLLFTLVVFGSIILFFLNYNKRKRTERPL